MTIIITIINNNITKGHITKEGVITTKKINRIVIKGTRAIIITRKITEIIAIFQ